MRYGPPRALLNVIPPLARNHLHYSSEVWISPSLSLLHSHTRRRDASTEPPQESFPAPILFLIARLQLFFPFFLRHFQISESSCRFPRFYAGILRGFCRATHKPLQGSRGRTLFNSWETRLWRTPDAIHDSEAFVYTQRRDIILCVLLSQRVAFNMHEPRDCWRPRTLQLYPVVGFQTRRLDLGFYFFPSHHVTGLTLQPWWQACKQSISVPFWFHYSVPYRPDLEETWQKHNWWFINSLRNPRTKKSNI